MTRKNILAGLIILVTGSLLIAACSAKATPATPTVDANAIYTQAAETVQAGIDQTEAAKPTVAATDTPVPTNTIEPTMAAGLTATAKAILQPVTGATATLAPGVPTPTKLAGLPTATSAVVSAPPKTSGDKAELVGQSPADGSTVQTNASFDVTLTLKNTGTTTWSTAYTLVFYAGDQMGSPVDFNMPHAVKPGETVKLIFTMTATSNAGSRRTIWAVRNGDGVNFYSLWLDMKVQ